MADASAYPTEESSATKRILINSQTVGDGLIHEAWRECVLPLMESQIDASRSLCDPRESFEAYLLNDTTLVSTSVGCRNCQRDYKHIAHYDHDFVVFHHFLSGGSHYQNGTHQQHASRYSSLLVDLSEPFNSQIDQSDIICLIIPRDRLIESGFNRDRFSGILLTADDPCNIVIHHAMLAAYQQVKQANQQQAGTISDALIGLICGMMSPALQDHNNPQTESATLSTMLSYLDHNLTDSSLGIDSLVRKFHRSRSVIYRLFSPLGGVNHYIQRHRLHRCYQALISPAQCSRKINAIAMQWGFSSQSHFSRLFKEHYHTTPKDAREAALHHELKRINGCAETYNDYLRQAHQWFLNPSN